MICKYGVPMIIQKKDGSLVCVTTGATWEYCDYSNAITHNNSQILHPCADEGRAFLDALAREMSAVRWEPEKRRFVEVE